MENNMTQVDDNHQDLELKDFFTYAGRINRAKYFNIWGWNFTALLTFILLSVLFTALGTQLSSTILKGIGTISMWILGLIFLVGTVSLTLNGIRRAHDSNLSGWFSIIPIYNIYIVLFKKGTAGENDYGNNPLDKKLPTSTTDEVAFNSQQKIFRTFAFVCVFGGLGTLAILFLTGYL